MEITAFCARPENKQKDIFSDKVWNSIRYGEFAAQLSDKLQD